MDTPHDQAKLDSYVSRNGQLIIKTVGALGIFYGMVLVPLQKVTADIDYIKNNHLAHIEAEITEIRKFQSEETGHDNDRDVNIEKIVTMLEQHEKYTQAELSKK